MYDNIEENPYKHKKKMEFLEAGFALFSRRYGWTRPVRALTLRAIRLQKRRYISSPEEGAADP